MHLHPRDEYSPGKSVIAKPWERRKGSDKRTNPQNQDGSSEWRSLTGGGNWGTVWGQPGPGRPKPGLWEEAEHQQYYASLLLLHSHLLGLRGCCFINKWRETLRTARNLLFNKAPSSHISPYHGEMNTFGADLYSRARCHQGSPPSRLQKGQCSGVRALARRVLLEGKGILLPAQDNPSYLQPRLCCWTCIQLCACCTPSWGRTSQ